MNLFDRKAAATIARESLGLPRVGRLTSEQKFALDADVKAQYLDVLVENGIIPNKSTRNILFHASFPRNVEGHMETPAAIKRFKSTTKKFNAAGGPALVGVINLEFHDGCQEVEWEEPVEAGRPADGTRKQRSPNRSKAEIEADRAAAELRREGRTELGFNERGRLTSEQQEQLDAWISDNS